MINDVGQSRTRVWYTTPGRAWIGFFWFFEDKNIPDLQLELLVSLDIIVAMAAEKRSTGAD